jgi:hypothetical protein
VFVFAFGMATGTGAFAAKETVGLGTVGETAVVTPAVDGDDPDGAGEEIPVVAAFRAAIAAGPPPPLDDE